MSSLTNINNNASVVNVGRTTPVSPGQQTADKSIPVVIASDQEPIPVVEQNKVLSEVALSLLGIPRSEVALGIFADVNTYDVNPSEWSSVPAEYTLNSAGDGWGIKHLPEEAGALIEAPKDKTAVLTSKRFFRYQPGRVSAATFGVKSTISPSSNAIAYDLNPSIRKYGIFDKYDGYYWETRSDGVGDNFSVVRRTQSLLRNNPVPFGTQTADHAVSGKAPNVYTDEPNASPTATKFLIDNRFKIIETAFTNALAATGADLAAATTLAGLSDANKAKCKRDMDLAMEAYILDLQYGGNAHTIVNGTTYRIAGVANEAVEFLVHRYLGAAIVSALPASESAAATKIYVPPASPGAVPGGLVGITYQSIDSVNSNPYVPYPGSTEINAALYGSRSPIATVFAIYSRYYAYIASEYTFNEAMTGIVPVNYSAATNTLSTDEIKYRCYRDVTYILKGYAEDLEFGGDASTLYNAKRYYFNGSQIYSQTPNGSPNGSGPAGEILRHEFIKALLTNNTVPPIPTPAPGGNKTIPSLKVLFPNVFGSTPVVNKLNDLADKIISNFETEYVGNIEYGRGANYGDLVVLRDGLIMTHAAVFDPTLLKATKNVVVKPNNIFRRTVNSGTGSTVVIDSATNVTRGMTVSGNGITPGTYITNISGTTLTLSNTATVTASQAIYFGNSTLETSQDEFVVGQYINFYGTAAGANSHGLVANRLYRVEKVRGSKGNIITLSDATTKNKLKVNITLQGNPATSAILSIAPSGNPDAVVLGPGMRIEGKGLPEGTVINQASGSDWIISTIPSTNLENVEITKIAMISPDVDPVSPTLIYINPNVPFIFPTEYHTGKDPTNTASFKKYDGVFPLMYALEGLPAIEAPAVEKVGYIDTSIVEETEVIKQQIDTVNLIYNNWVKQNVDPKYYSVYEYRVPRSRFSTDQLNGATNSTVYSDVATADIGGRVFAGTPVLKDGAVLETKSVWDIDFTKVTMLKVEFSWYGAVGALFLAYVPVGNGDARWVRVHHLRASNQLKISSLGNATLPITYLVYGGGSVSRLGIEDATNKGYTRSNHIVKYGASYYIDGGDRGTVRLYSHSTIENTDVFGSRYNLSGATVGSDANGAYIDVSSVSNIPTDVRYFMKSKILTNSKADQNVEVIWTYEQTTPSVVKKLYISKDSLISSTNLIAISNRPSVVFGLKAKQDILNSVGTGIRNRVQVYPTKLSTSSIAPTGVTTIPKVKLQLLKTPLFQPIVTTTGAFSLTADYPITPANAALPTSSSSYLAKDGEGIYGWFRANVGTVFGYLYKQGGNYYFNLLETYSEEVILKQTIPFLADGRFGFNGAPLSTVSEDTIQKERLSSVFVSTQIQAPIPKTGTEVASFFLKEGADLFDLLTYFDYNKDYLSFPLTDKVESVYLTASSIQNATFAVGVPTTVAEVSSSLTWEEQ